MEENKPENNDEKHKKHHFWQRRHEKEKEIANHRGQAAAYATVGTIGTLGWGTAEAMGSGLASELAEVALFEASDKISKKAWKRIGAVVGGVAVGAFVYAGIKHFRAEKLQAELNEKDSSPSPLGRGLG